MCLCTMDNPRCLLLPSTPDDWEAPLAGFEAANGCAIAIAKEQPNNYDVALSRVFFVES